MSKADRLESYPWYPSDWRSDPEVLALSLAAQGLYRAVLDLVWEVGWAPTELALICKLASLERLECKNIWPRVRPFFYELDGQLRHRKVDEKRPLLLKLKETRSAVGSAGGKAKAALRAEQKIYLEHAPGRSKLCSSPSPSPSPVAKATAAGAADSVSIDDTGWPKFSEAIRSRFPTVDDHLIRKIVEETVRVYPPVTDENLVSAFMAASESDRKQYSPALYVQTIPRVIKSWIVQA